MTKESNKAFNSKAKKNRRGATTAPSWVKYYSNLVRDKIDRDALNETEAALFDHIRTLKILPYKQNILLLYMLADPRMAVRDMKDDLFDIIPPRGNYKKGDNHSESMLKGHIITNASAASRDARKALRESLKGEDVDKQVKDLVERLLSKGVTYRKFRLKHGGNTLG